MGRIAGLLLLLMQGVAQAQEAVPAAVAGKDKLATAQAVADKKVAAKVGSKTAPVPVEATASPALKEEAGKPGGGKVGEEAPEESVQLKGLRG